MKTNFHTHTVRCKHASGSEEDFVLSAIDSGLDILGFSDHGPFPDRDFGLRMLFDELPEYISEIDRLSVSYSDKIKLYKGLEIEYHPVYENYYRELLEKHGLDYLALGEHMYTEPSGEIKNIYFAQGTEDYLNYAENVALAERSGLFAFCAHPDLMFLNKYEWDSNCDKACEIILQAAESSGIILELNANGLRRGFSPFPDGTRWPYPHEGFWKRLSGSSQRVIIGSDAHVPEQVCDHMVLRSYELADRWKLNVVDNIFTK